MPFPADAGNLLDRVSHVHSVSAQLAEGDCVSLILRRDNKYACINMSTMLGTSSSASAFGRPSTRPRTSMRPASKDGEKQAIWVPMLNNASKGKDLTEKQLIVLGGTPEQQKEFLDQLNPEHPRPRYNDRRKQHKAPLSNRYTLGYTYHDVLDADHEDVLARLNVYMLSSPSAAFAPLLQPLLSSKTVKDTMITILLDWSEPSRWARQLRQWIRLLRSVILTLDDEVKIAMEETMTAWREKRVGTDTLSGAEQKGQSVSLGSGEWDEGLGIPLSVVCIQSEKIESIEREQGWSDEQFDYLTQWLRCVLLKHGASLIYTASFDANNVRQLLHSSLNIQSLLKREVIKPNYIERDKILIPPNWDSWGKIRPLREGTDLEAISDAWSVEIQGQPVVDLDLTSPEPESTDQSAVFLYESTLPHSSSQSTSIQPRTQEDEENTVPSVQEFLQSQNAILETLKAEDEKSSKKSRKATSSTGTGTSNDDRSSSNTRMTEQIGAYQINVNGIDFDAEEATRHLREREADRRKDASPARPEPRPSNGSGLSTPTRGKTDDGKQSNEAMSAFFANLIKKDKRGGGVGSGAVSPTRGSPAPERRLE